MPGSSRPGTGRSRGRVDAAGEHDRVELAAQLVDRHVHADVGVGAEHDAFFAEQREPAIEDSLLELELGNAVAEQPADAIGALEHRDRVAGAIELRRRREARRPRTDDRDTLAGPGLRRAARSPSLRRTRGR